MRFSGKHGAWILALGMLLLAALWSIIWRGEIEAGRAQTAFYAERFRQLQAHMAADKADTAEASNRLAAAMNDADGFKKQAENERQRNDPLRRKIEELTGQGIDADARIQTLTGQVKTLEQQVADGIAKLAVAVTEKQRLTADVSAGQQQIQTLTQSSVTLKANLAAAEQSAAVLDAKLKDLQGLRQKLETDLAVATAGLSASRQAAAALKQELDTTRKALTAAQAPPPPQPAAPAAAGVAPLPAK